MYIVDVLNIPLLNSKGVPVGSETLASTLSAALYTNRETDGMKIRKIGRWARDFGNVDNPSVSLDKTDFDFLVTLVEKSESLFDGAKFQILERLDFVKEKGEV